MRLTSASIMSAAMWVNGTARRCRGTRRGTGVDLPALRSDPSVVELDCDGGPVAACGGGVSAAPLSSPDCRYPLSSGVRKEGVVGWLRPALLGRGPTEAEAVGEVVRKSGALFLGGWRGAGDPSWARIGPPTGGDGGVQGGYRADRDEGDCDGHERQLRGSERPLARVGLDLRHSHDPQEDRREDHQEPQRVQEERREGFHGSGRV